MKGIMIEGIEDNQKVADFINEEGRWKLEQVKQRIGEEIVKEINVVPICINGGKDIIVWSSSKDEVYSIKSGYHVIKDKTKEGTSGKASTSHKIKGEM